MSHPQPTRPTTPPPRPSTGTAWISSINATLSFDEARALTDQIVKKVDGFVPLVKRAYQERADKVLGYPNWNAYCDAELRGIRIPLSDVPTAVAQMRETGMSVRAIGSALGMPKSSVADTMTQLSADGQLPEPERVKSLDGRERPATMPARQDVAEKIVDAIEKKIEQTALSTSSGQDLPPAPKPTPAQAQREQIFAARRTARTLAGSLLEDIGALVAASRAGAPEVITPELVAALRSAVDVLEAEMLGRELDAS